MPSIFRKCLQHRVPQGATRKIGKGGVTQVSWRDRQQRPCRGTVAIDGSGAEVVRYKSPTYFIRYRDADDIIRVKDTGSSDKEQARIVLSELLSDVRTLRIDPDAAVRSKLQHVASMPLDPLLDEYLSTLRGSHRSSISSQLRRVIAQCRWRTVKCIRRAELESLRDELLDAHHDNRAIAHKVLSKPQTPTLRNIRGFLIAAKGFCTWLAKTHHVPNRLYGVACPKPSKSERRQRRAIGVGEFQSLIEAAQSDVRNLHGCVEPGVLGKQAALIYSTLMFTGIRISALKRLCIKDVKLEQDGSGHLSVSQKVRGREAQELRFVARLGELVREWLEIRGRDGAHPADRLIIWPARARHHFISHCRTAGISRLARGRVIDMGGLRGSCNTHMFHAGVSAAVRARVLGHTDTKLVETRYLLLEEFTVDDAAARLEQRLTAGVHGDPGAAAAA